VAELFVKINVPSVEHSALLSFTHNVLEQHSALLLC
jgi:hypothetical protein